MNEERKCEIVFGQYKLHAELAEGISQRRGDTNKFFVAVLGGLLAVLSLALDPDQAPGIQTVLLLASGAAGLILCRIWRLTLESYRQVNEAKFAVLTELEKSLPAQCFAEEWARLGEGSDPEKYRPLTQMEQSASTAMAVPFSVLIIYALGRIAFGALRWFSCQVLPCVLRP